MKSRFVISYGFLAIFISGCVAVPSPAVRADASNKYWTLLEDIEWSIGKSEVTLTVPAGFVTDYASVPQGLWSIGLSPHDRYSRASIIHDYLYWSQVCTKEQSDRLMVIAMKDSKVGSFDEFAVYKGVQYGGQKSWDENTELRKKGLPRVIPVELRKPHSNLDWPDYQKQLLKRGVKDPTFPVSPRYCSLGNTTELPMQAAK